MRTAAGSAAAVLASFLFAASARALEVREAHYVMGTILEITVEAPQIETGRQWIRDGVAEARRLEREFTSFDSQSALSELNRQAGTGFHRIPIELFEILAQSKDLSRLSNGTFDVSVGPLIELWNGAAARDKWPAAEEIEASRRMVGYGNIRLRSPDEAELALPGMELDLGGIGKGYAADRIAEELRGFGARSALINFGESSIVALGPVGETAGWPVWIRRKKTVEGPLRLRDCALSTSGSFGHSHRISHRRVGHVIDPRTGRPLLEERQVTVIAPTATEAEGWSKALLIEPAAMLRTLEARNDLAGAVFTPSGKRSSKRFAALTGWKARSR